MEPTFFKKCRPRPSVLKCFWRQHRGSNAFFLFLGSDYKLTEQLYARLGIVLKHAMHPGPSRAHWGCWLFRYRRASYGWDICSKKFPAASTARSVAIKTCPGSRKCRILGTGDWLPSFKARSVFLRSCIWYHHFPIFSTEGRCHRMSKALTRALRLDGWIVGRGQLGCSIAAVKACKFTCPLLEVSLVNKLPCICQFLIQKTWHICDNVEWCAITTSTTTTITTTTTPTTPTPRTATLLLLLLLLLLLWLYQYHHLTY